MIRLTASASGIESRARSGRGGDAAAAGFEPRICHRRACRNADESTPVPLHYGSGREPSASHRVDDRLDMRGAQFGHRDRSDRGEDVAIEWQRIEGRRWERICDCGTETTYEPAPSRVRQDPYDPATSRHAGQCELKDTTDRDILKVKPGLDEGYMWVTCGSCEHEWAVADYAEESVR